MTTLKYQVTDEHMQAYGAVNATTQALDVPHLWVHWIHGDPSAGDSPDDPRSTGGWSWEAADFNRLADQLGLEVPKGTVEYQRVSRSGEVKTFHAVRSLPLAEIGSRFRWKNFDGEIRSEYAPGFRSNMHIVALAVTRTKDGNLTAFPVIISLSGLSTKHWSEAKRAWNALTQSHRDPGGYAAGVPSQFFAAPIGTFGPANYVKAGKVQTSTTTPLTLWPGAEGITEQAHSQTQVDPNAWTALSKAAIDFLEAWDVEAMETQEQYQERMLEQQNPDPDAQPQVTPAPVDEVVW